MLLYEFVEAGPHLEIMGKQLNDDIFGLERHFVGQVGFHNIFDYRILISNRKKATN